MKTNLPLRYLINKLNTDTISYQAVLQEFPFNLRLLRKGLLNGISLARSGPRASWPMFLCIESSARCNLKCPMCPRTDLLTRETGNMNYGLYKTIVGLLKPVLLTLSQFGEPFIHPRIIDMIRFASRRGIAVRITTNATLLTPQLSRQIIEAGLFHLQISFDSCSKELYEKIRQGTIFERVVDNIKMLLSLKKELSPVYPMVSFNMTLNKDNVGEVSGMINFCLREFGIAPTFTRMYTYGEYSRVENSLDNSDLEVIREAYLLAKSYNLDMVCKNLSTIYKDIAYPLKGNRPCFFPYYTVSVTWDGKVYPCCMYFDKQLTFGDLTRESFKDIWNGPGYQQFRHKLRQNREGILICSSCPLVDIGINNMVARYRPISALVNMISKRNFSYINRNSK